MKTILELTKNSPKEIYLLLFNHWKKLSELCVLFIIISSLTSVVIAFFITSAGNLLYFGGLSISLESLLYSYEQTHLLEISTSIYFVNTAIFAIFLLKHKNDIAKTRIKDVLQLKDTKLYSSWFLGLLCVAISELIFYNDFFGVNINSGILGLLDSYAPIPPINSWLNSIINLFQRTLPLLVSLYIVATYLVPKFQIKEFKKITKPVITTLIVTYAISTIYYSFSQDLSTYVFQLLIIPFESFWIYLLVVFSITLFLQAFLFTFIGGSNNFNIDITNKAEEALLPNHDDILDSTST